MTWSRLRRTLPPLLAVAIFAGVLAALHHELSDLALIDVEAALRGLRPSQILLSLLLTAVSYAVLTGYDALALVYLHHWLPFRRVALASFTGYVVNHNLGPLLLGGSAIRYRLYASWGLSAGEIAMVIAFVGVTFWLGFVALTSGVLLAAPATMARTFGLTPITLGILGAAGALVIAAYLVWCGRRRPLLRLGGWQLAPPSLSIGATQIALTVVDWIVAASVLWVLLPATPSPTILVPFLASFLLAQVLGVASGVPAGLGVFETTMIMALRDLVPQAELLGALLAFRVIYFVLPLMVAALLLGAHELVRRRDQARAVGRQLEQWTTVIVPQALTLATFLAGMLVLFGGSLPSSSEDLARLERYVPLPLHELSSFLASVAGMGLVLLARGLQRRIAAAYWATLAFLTAGAALTLARGFDLAEAAVLVLALVALLPCRRRFDRPSTLLDAPFTPAWTFAGLLVLIGTGGLLLFCHRHVAYTHELWWQFTLTGQTSRSMRALVGAACVLVAYGIARLLRPLPPDRQTPSPLDQTQIREIVAESPRAAAHLALLGDKSFLLSASHRGFLMYGVAGRSFVSMGDPVGAPEDAHELAWRFRELADRHGGQPVFYEVGTTNLSLYVDLGLTLLKVGEEARVPLPTFDLAGPARSGLRQAHHRATREGCSFEILPAVRAGEVLDQVEEISSAWLAEKSTREKGFSLGRFDPDYLRQLPIALVRREGQPLAFANLWLGRPGEELSLDLMRHLPGSPPGLMDYLFIEILLWGKQQGYAWFSFGLAPFSGMETHALAPLWSRAGAFLFRHGEHFYNFQGLRHYKDKFDPEWSPRYLASPGRLAIARTLADVASLVSGGLSGIVTR